MRHQRRNTTTPQPSLETPALFRKTVKLAYYRLSVEVVAEQHASEPTYRIWTASAIRRDGGQPNTLPPSLEPPTIGNAAVRVHRAREELRKLA
jgi:hypothetical protein